MRPSGKIHDVGKATGSGELHALHGSEHSIYSPMTYVHPSSPIYTSCTFPAGTSMRTPVPKVSFLLGFSSGLVTVNSPERIE